MIVTSRGSVFRLLFWQWKATTLFTLCALGVVLLNKFAGVGWNLPALPLGVAGGALGIFVSFRTNSAYDRWWEGRKLWGRMINSSRHFCSQAIVYLGDNGVEAAKAYVRRHVAYVHTLRCLLREQDPFADGDVVQFLTEEEKTELPGQSNVTHALLHAQLTGLRAEAAAQNIDDFQLQSLDRTIASFLDIQGGCERIKKTPMPRGYGFIAERLVVAFGCLLPFALVKDLGWVTIPISVLVCLSFALISEAGRVLEDPFTMYWNGLPLFALSKTIETNLRERTGERGLPPLPKPNAKGILM